MGRYGSEKKYVLPARKIRIRQAAWNFRSFLTRLLLALIALFLLFWLLLQLNQMFFYGLVERFLHSEEPSKEVNFTIAFSNAQRQYSLQRPPTDACQGRRVKLVVLVMSRREAAERRKGIRNSWARDAPEGVLVRFVIGAAMADEKDRGGIEEQLEKEQIQHGDLIRYSIEDGYANLHFKMSAAFQWQLAFCPNAEYVMKSDDDTIVDLQRWEHWTERKFKKDLESNPRAYFGYVLFSTSPIRDRSNKWYVSVDDFPGDRYPRYMQGATYFGTRAAIRAVMAHTQEVRGFNMDDLIFTGTLAEIANVTRHAYNFKHFRGGDPLVDDEPCEGGMPTVFAIFRQLKTAEEFVKEYKQLHSIKCK